MSVLLEARAVTKRHGPRDPLVLQPTSLSIRRGEIVVIVGASGSGKSTLLRLLAGIDTPTDGEVVFEGTSLASRDDAWLARFRRERAAFVFQAHNLLPGLSAEENVMLPLQLGGRARKDAREDAHAALDAVGLLGRARSLPTTLSGGESQRVAIARSLAQKTDLVFADEPTASLDSVTGRLVLDQLVGTRDRTVVVVTHDREIARMADRVVTVRDGRASEGTELASGVRLQCA